jgi:hypothetical protein
MVDPSLITNPVPSGPENGYDRNPEDIVANGGSRPTATANLAPDSQADSDGEPSIEEYMAQLLGRLRPCTGSAAAGSEPERCARPSTVELRSAGSLDDNRPVTEPHSSSEAEAVPDRNSVERAARPSPAECAAAVKAMRELANETARGAIDTHAQRRLMASIRRTLIVALGATTASLMLAGFALCHNSTMNYVGAALILAVAALISRRYVRLTRELCGAGLDRLCPTLLDETRAA